MTQKWKKCGKHLVSEIHMMPACSCIIHNTHGNIHLVFPRGIMESNFEREYANTTRFAYIATACITYDERLSVWQLVGITLILVIYSDYFCLFIKLIILVPYVNLFAASNSLKQFIVQLHRGHNL